MSETFVTDQARLLSPRFRPVFLGRSRFGPAPPSVSALTLR
ncbi:MAG: glycosyl transferase, partial [Gluconacetobacter diazotrophicus]|nr:glycosyl transferase [Gluconacetobacter diazotrophicus]